MYYRQSLRRSHLLLSWFVFITPNRGYCLFLLRNVLILEIGVLSITHWPWDIQTNICYFVLCTHKSPMDCDQFLVLTAHSQTKWSVSNWEINFLEIWQMFHISYWSWSKGKHNVVNKKKNFSEIHNTKLIRCFIEIHCMYVHILR